MKKKDIPLKLLKDFKIVKEFVRDEVSQYEIIELESEELSTLKVIDIDKDSTFYFYLHDLKLTNDGSYFDITYSPANDKVTSETSERVDVNTFKAIFKKWIEIIIEYNSIPIMPEDNILKAYEDEFYAEFEIVDENASVDPFSLKQQLLIDEYLESIEHSLEEHKPEKGVDEIIEETQALRNSITTLTKRSVIRRISKILSKITKFGLPLIKEIYSEVKKELIKKAIEGSFDGLGHLLK